MTEETGAAPAATDETAVVETPALAPAEAPTTEIPGEETLAAPVEEAKPPKKTAQQRIDELTHARREAEREAAHWREEAQKPRAPAPAPQPTEGQPDPTQYAYGESDPAFIRDAAVFQATQAVRAEFQSQRETDLRQAAQLDFKTRRDSFAAKVGDKDEGAIFLLSDLDAPVTPQMADIIFASENGVKVADHLGRNLAEARRIASLPPHLQGVALAKLEATLSTAAPIPKTATTAPEPANHTRGAGGRFAPSPDTSDFAQFEQLADGILAKK